MGLDSLPSAAASAWLQPPLVKTIPAVTAMVWGSGGSGGLELALFDTRLFKKMNYFFE